MATPTAMAAPHIPDIEASKRLARIAAIARRAGCDPVLGQALTAYAAGLARPGDGVAGFWPLPGEIDIRPLLTALHAAGHIMSLPETPPRGQALRFRRWHPGAPLVPGRFGTVHPDTPEVTPGTLLLPLLAFDRHGQRLGYGGGYYDRTLAALPGVRAIGCAFAAQEVEHVPVGPYDQPLHAVATERGVVWFGG